MKAQGRSKLQVVSARSALLSNYEVLSLLRELETTQLAQTKIALRVKKEEDERIAAAALSKKGKGKEKEVVAPSTVLQTPIEEVSENLRTVEFEVRICRIIVNGRFSITWCYDRLSNISLRTTNQLRDNPMQLSRNS